MKCFTMLTVTAAFFVTGVSSTAHAQRDISAGLRDQPVFEAASSVPADTGFDNDGWAVTVYNGDLIVGGSFFNAPGASSFRVAGFDGSGWYSMSGIAAGNPVYNLYVHDGELYAGYAIPRLNSWDGNSWTEHLPHLGSGIQGSLLGLTTYNNQLVVGGNFRFDALQPSYIAVWNGAGWDSLGTEIAGTVQALTVFDSELIAGGFFNTGGGSAVNRIARWNGSAWSTLGGGITGSSGGVRAFATFNGDLIAGGSFTTVGGTSATNIARWNGSGWEALGDGLDGGQVYTLTVHNGKLIAGGLFQNSGVTPTAYVASWNDTAWSALGAQIDDRVNGLGVYNGYLIAAGRFTTAGGYIALWDGAVWRPVIDIATDVSDQGAGTLPAAFSLDQNYPNPFNPSTSIHYSLTRPSGVQIQIFNIRGQRVRQLVDQLMPAGEHEVRWDGTSDAGKEVATGTYFYQLSVDGATETRKLMLLK